jgi:hypothetical protein
MYPKSKNSEYYAQIRAYTRLLKAFPGNSHILKLRADFATAKELRKKKTGNLNRVTFMNF